MYICSCNPFTDKDVKRVLEEDVVRKTPGQVYKACSGGERPCCGTCLCMIKDMVVDHQSARGVKKLKDELPALSDIELMAAE